MNEVQIAAVNEVSQLNTAKNAELYETVVLASNIFKTPLAALTLLDEGNLSIKLKVGLPDLSSDKVVGFCNYTMVQQTICIVEDTHAHEHFSQLSKLPDGTEVRFFAAAPLITKQGLCLGVLCVIDYVPHLDAKQDELSLHLAAKHVISIMEERMNLRKLDHSFSELEIAKERAIQNEIKLRALFESLTDVYVFLGMSGEILDFNQAAYDYILKFKGKKMVKGTYTADYLNEVDNTAFMANFKLSLNGERVNQEMLSSPEVANRVWWDSIFEPVRNKNGEMMGVSYIARDVSKRKLDSEKLVKQNRILTKIAHIHAHEYRGPVSTILGMMDLIEGEGNVPSAEYLQMLKRAVKALDDKTRTVINLISDLDEM